MIMQKQYKNLALKMQLLRYNTSKFFEIRREGLYHKN